MMIAYIPCDHHLNRNSYSKACGLCQDLDLAPVIEAYHPDANLTEIHKALIPLIDADKRRREYPKMIEAAMLRHPSSI